MSIERRKPQTVLPISGWLLTYLQTGELSGHSDWLAMFRLTSQPDALTAEWARVQDAVVADWIVQHPGTRPWAWWVFDAPSAVPPEKWRDTCQAALWKDPRRRLGGIGTPCPEALAYAPRFAFGIPIHWVSAWQVAYYNGRARDIHGNRIGTNHHEGHFPYDAIDPDDPPQFESQAAYLARHGLLTPAERGRLPPDAVEPEVLTVTDHDEGDAA